MTTAKPINAIKGKQNFQPLLNEDQLTRLMMFWAPLDFDNQEARKFLKENFDIQGISNNALWKWKTKLRKRWDRARKEPDQPVDWFDTSTMIKNHVFTDHLAELHDRYNELKAQAEVYGIAENFPEITYRGLKWESWVLQYYGHLVTNPVDRSYIAALFEVRDVAADYLETDRDYSDLEGWLRHRPWEGGEREAQYLQATQFNIPPLDLDGIKNLAYNVGMWVHEEAYRTGDRDSHEGIYHSGMGMAMLITNMADGTITGDKPFLLPSKIYTEKEMHLSNL